MSAFLSILWRELRAFYLTPVAYVFTVIFLILIGVLTFIVGGFFLRGEASLSASFFQWMPLMLALFAPAVGMRMWSDENRQGTLILLFSQPVSLMKLVLAKFFAGWIALSAPLILTIAYVVTVHYLGDPDENLIISGYFGAVLMGGSFIAISCLCSAAARSQVVAFIISAAICLALVLMGTSRLSNEFLTLFPGSRDVVDAITSIAVNKQYDGFRKGLIETRAIFYFFTLSGFALLLNYIIMLRKQS